jgi:hypothetical protein
LFLLLTFGITWAYWIPAALLGKETMTLPTLLLHSLTSAPPHVANGLSWMIAQPLSILFLLLAGLISIPIPKALGWLGFVLDRLQARVNPLFAAAGHWRGGAQRSAATRRGCAEYRLFLSVPAHLPANLAERLLPAKITKLADQQHVLHDDSPVEKGGQQTIRCLLRSVSHGISSVILSGESSRLDLFDARMVRVLVPTDDPAEWGSMACNGLNSPLFSRAR